MYVRIQNLALADVISSFAEDHEWSQKGSYWTLKTTHICFDFSENTFSFVTKKSPNPLVSFEDALITLSKQNLVVDETIVRRIGDDISFINREETIVIKRDKVETIFKLLQEFRKDDWSLSVGCQTFNSEDFEKVLELEKM